jgi:hypothetical protein
MSRNFLQGLFNIMSIIRSKISLSYNLALCYNSLGRGKGKKFRGAVADYLVLTPTFPLVKAFEECS